MLEIRSSGFPAGFFLGFQLTDHTVFNIGKMQEQKNMIATSEIIWLIVGQVEKTAKGNVAHFLQTDTS